MVAQSSTQRAGCTTLVSRLSPRCSSLPPSPRLLGAAVTSGSALTLRRRCWQWGCCSCGRGSRALSASWAPSPPPSTATCALHFFHVIYVTYFTPFACLLMLPVLPRPMLTPSPPPCLTPTHVMPVASAINCYMCAALRPNSSPSCSCVSAGRTRSAPHTDCHPCGVFPCHLLELMTTNACVGRRLFPALPKPVKQIEGSPIKGASPVKVLPPASPQPKIVAKVS